MDSGKQKLLVTRLNSMKLNTVSKTTTMKMMASFESEIFIYQEK